MGVLASLFFNQLCALLWLLRRGFRPRDEIPELTLTVPETGGPMVLKIRGKNGQTLVLENAPILGQGSETQRLTGLGMDTPVQVVLPAVLPDQIQFWRVRTGQ